MSLWFGHSSKTRAGHSRGRNPRKTLGLGVLGTPGRLFNWALRGLGAPGLRTLGWALQDCLGLGTSRKNSGVGHSRKTQGDSGLQADSGIKHSRIWVGDLRGSLVQENLGQVGSLGLGILGSLWGL